LVDGGVHGLASHRCLDAWLLANKSSMSIGARLAMSELEAVGA